MNHEAGFLSDNSEQDNFEISNEEMIPGRDSHLKRQVCSSYVLDLKERFGTSKGVQPQGEPSRDLTWYYPEKNIPQDRDI